MSSNRSGGVFILENRALVLNCGKGVLRAFFVTLILLLVLSLISANFEISSGIRSSGLLITTLFSVMYGSIYASKKTGHKGWLNGFVVAIFYMVVFYIVAIVGGRDLALNLNDFFRVLLAIAVGTLSGMLGINI